MQTKHKRRLRSIVVTFIPCYIFWLLLTLSLEPTELLMGVVICLLTALFSSSFFVQNEEDAFRFFNPLRIIYLVVFFVVIFTGELFRSNWAMAKTVLLRRPFHQAIVKIPVTGIKNYYGLAMLADCITLTPGTITMDVIDEDGEISMYVQWINMESSDPEVAGEIIKGRMEKWLRRIWG